MVLDILFEQTLHKLSQLKINAPPTSGFVNYNCKMAYSLIYCEYFDSRLNQKIQQHDKMKNDAILFNNIIFNNIIGNNHDMRNATNTQPFKYSQFQSRFTYAFNQLSDATRIYLNKLCDIVLSDAYNIKEESDADLISLYWILKFVPVYFEAIDGCYKIYTSGSARYELIADINKYLDKYIAINFNYKLIYGGQPNFHLYFELFKNLIKDNVPDFFNYIDKKCNEMMKIMKYKNNAMAEQHNEPVICNKEKVGTTTINMLAEQNNKSDKVVSTNANNIGTKYNTIKASYKKDDLIKLAIEKGIIFNSKSTVASLEELILDKLEGKNISEKANKLNIFGNKNTSVQGYKNVILGTLTNTFNSFESIPKTIKALVWNEYIGEDKGIGACYVCQSKLDSKHFECGHIKAKVKGGSDTIDNLRPVCSLCNKSIGTKNMNDFKAQYFVSNNK